MMGRRWGKDVMSLKPLLDVAQPHNASSVTVKIDTCKMTFAEHIELGNKCQDHTNLDGKDHKVPRI
jgi:hypothetical protein